MTTSGALGILILIVGATTVFAELETNLGRRVHLFLHVKVKPDWQDDRSVYRDMGLDWVE